MSIFTSHENIKKYNIQIKDVGFVAILDGGKLDYKNLEIPGREVYYLFNIFYKIPNMSSPHNILILVPAELDKYKEVKEGINYFAIKKWYKMKDFDKEIIKEYLEKNIYE